MLRSLTHFTGELLSQYDGGGVHSSPGGLTAHCLHMIFTICQDTRLDKRAGGPTPSVSLQCRKPADSVCPGRERLTRPDIIMTSWCLGPA